MRPATPRYRYATLTASLLFAALSASAALEHRVKADDTPVFRTRLLEPPPLATLAEGDAVELIHQGRSESMVKTDGNVRGWMRNADLVAVKVSFRPRKAFTRSPRGFLPARTSAFSFLNSSAFSFWFCYSESAMA